MKHSTVVIFVSRPEEVSAAEEILKKASDHKPAVIASTPEAAVKLLESRIDFIDSDVFYPTTHQIKSWQKKLLKLCLSWHLRPKINRILTVNSVNLGKVCELGIHIYLGEIGHSLLTAKNLIQKLRPKIIYVSDGFIESPFQRYQTESFTLEPLAIRLTAKKLGIEIVGLGQPLSLSPRILLILRQLAASFLSDIRRIFSYRQSPPATDFIFVGNHYQLVNLLPTLTVAKDKIKFIVTGKASPEIIHQVTDRGIAFIPFEKLAIGSYRAFDFLKYLASWLMVKSLLKETLSAVDPLIWKLVEPKLFWYFIEEFPETAGVIRAASVLLSKSPKAIITMATSDHFSRAIALTSLSKKIPVVELQHGLYRIDVEYPFRSNDYFLVWSSKERNILYQGKTHPHKYPLAGYPWFDQYQNIQTESDSLRRSGRNQIDAGDSDNVILMLATFPKDLDDDRLAVSISPFRYASMVFAAVKKLPGKWKVIFRPHPSCKSEWIKDLAGLKGIHLIYDDRKMPLKQSLAAADLVIANFTTAIVDAVIMEKPVLIHTFLHIHKNSLKNFPSIKTRAADYFENSKQLEKLIAKFQKHRFKTDGENKKNFLINYINPTGRPASKQLVNYLKNFSPKPK